jgi:hypothetical protein
MAVALSLTQKEYILEVDRDLPVEQQTKFFIKPLSARQNAALQDGMKFSKKEDGATIENIGTHTLEILKAGLVGWDNFNDAEGNPIKFTKDAEVNIDKLCVEYRYELSGAIMELSNLGPVKEKN